MAPQYRQKFRPEYKQHVDLQLWITEDPSDPYTELCKYCKGSLKCKLYDLVAHSSTKNQMEKSS